MKLSLIFTILFSLDAYSQICDSLLESVSNPGPFVVGSYDENSGIRNGLDYDGSTIYYPLNSFSNALPSIIIAPGFMNTEFTIQNWGPFLASNGIITMTIGTNSLTDSHIQRKDALLDALVSLKSENFRANSPLYLKIDTTKIAVGGFSKGGGGAQLVPSENDEIKAIVALYPWLENPVASDLNHQVPIIFISGQLDIIAPPLVHADIHYDLTPNETKKLKYEVAFSSHDALSGPNGGGGEVGVRVISWLNTFLLGDTCYCPLAIQNASTSSSYITNVSCENIITNSFFSNSTNDNQNIIIKDILGRNNKIGSYYPLFFFNNKGFFEKRIIIEK